MSESDALRRVRPIAVCVLKRRDGALLVAPGYDRVKQQRFYRPLGGEIEFGERAEDAVRREILEETGSDLDGLRLLDVSENIFTYQGRSGHEMVWTFAARLKDVSLYDREVVVCDEGGIKFEALWVPMGELSRPEAPLYPDGLLEILRAEL